MEEDPEAAAEALYAWLRKAAGENESEEKDEAIISTQDFTDYVQNGTVLNRIFHQIHSNDAVEEEQGQSEDTNASTILGKIRQDALSMLIQHQSSSSDETNIKDIVNEIDVHAASQGNVQALVELAALVLAAALSSDTSRNEHIEYVTSLNETYQETLMNVIKKYLGDDMGGADETHHDRQHSSSIPSEEAFNEQAEAADTNDKKSLQRRIDQLEMENDELKRENELLKQEANQGSNDVPSGHVGEEGFSNHVQELLTQLEEHQQEITRLRNEGESTREKLKDQLQTVQDERDLYKSKARSLERIEAEKEQYRQRAEAKQSSIEDLEAQVKDLEKQAESYKMSNRQLTSDTSEKEHKVFELSKELSEVKGERASLQDEVEKLRKSEKEINQEKRYLEEQLEASRSAVGTGSEKTDQSAQEEIERLRKQLRSLREERDTAKEASNEYYREVSRLKAEKENLQSELKRNSEEHDSSQAKATTNATNVEQSAEISRLREKVETLQNQLERKKEDVKDMEALKDERLELTKKISQLEEQIQEKENQLKVQRERTNEAMARSEATQPLISSTLYQLGNQFLRSQLLGKSSSHVSPLQQHRREVRKQAYRQDD
eukprot:gb/GECG01007509.1/.p1 GENE.gb/GECG01007509.1/~~gb/GECG01007509.1/.p1  ORF type:complete len:607 (+),score=157.78 gb/GECG01007509.1/:1-1821(+)